MSKLRPEAKIALLAGGVLFALVGRLVPRGRAQAARRLDA